MNSMADNQKVYQAIKTIADRALQGEQDVSSCRFGF